MLAIFERFEQEENGEGVGMQRKENDKWDWGIPYSIVQYLEHSGINENT